MINLLKKNYNSLDTNPIFAHRHMSRKILFLIMASVSSISIYGQTNTISSKELAGQLNTVTTMVPFITITPDSRSAGMGDRANLGMKSADIASALLTQNANSINNGRLADIKTNLWDLEAKQDWKKKLFDEDMKNYASQQSI